MTKWVYGFGDGKAEGEANTRDLLGGKGANLAEMSNLAAFPFRLASRSRPRFALILTRMKANIRWTSRRRSTPRSHGWANSPAAASGTPAAPFVLGALGRARASMPGMYGHDPQSRAERHRGRGARTGIGDARFAYDSYRRFIQMYSAVVLGLEHHLFEDALEEVKASRGHHQDTDLTADDWKGLAKHYLALVERESGAAFPQAPREQLWGAIGAVFGSWMNARAVKYRELHAIPASWGTAVNVQAMVFGNMGETSATGVAFTRNPSTGAAGASTANSSSMPRERMWSPAFARRKTSLKLPASRPAPTNRRSKRRCRRPSRSSSTSVRCSTPLSRHAGHGIHDRAGQALDAADAQRQAHDEGRIEDRRRSHP